MSQIYPTDQPHILGLSCPSPQEFRLAVEDPDVDDPEYVNLFIDYGVDQYSPIYFRTVLRNTGSALREPVTITFQANTPGVPLFTAGLHIVDVVVSDAELDSQRQPITPDAPDGGTADLRYEDVYTWAVESVAGGCQ